MASKVTDDKPALQQTATADATPDLSTESVEPVNAHNEGTAANTTSPSDFSEDQALAILQSAEVTAHALAQLARNPGALKSRKVMLALVQHFRTPRHVAVPLLRRLFTFDLLQVTLRPALANDIKRTAEEQILLRLESLSIGERISLARRSSGRVAAALLRDEDARVVAAALDNRRVVETGVVKALMKPGASELVFKLAAEHPKWSQRREVQIALLRSPKTPVEHRQRLAAQFSAEALEHLSEESDASAGEEN